MLLWPARAVALLAVLLTCYLTLTPDPSGAGLLPDWVGHVGMFGGMGASFALLYRVSAWPARRLWLLAAAVVFLAAATEAGQSYTGRQSDLRDLAFDIAGGLGAIVVTDLLLRQRMRLDRR